MSIAICNWQTSHGLIPFDVYPKDAFWNPVPGVYIFARHNGTAWEPVYIGQAASLAGRLSGHERWLEARRYGATAVHVKVIMGQRERDELERFLIRELRPVLNTHHLVA